MRRILKGAVTVEDSAKFVARYLYDHCVDGTTGERSSALVRFYKTHRYGDLDPELKQFAGNLLGDTRACRGG